ncbi:hypothetical protein ACLOJK_040599 [Asimina triloba]
MGDRAGGEEEEMADTVEEESLAAGSRSTMEKVAAAKQFIENHYRNQMKNMQERKERRSLIVRRCRKQLGSCLMERNRGLDAVVCLEGVGLLL